MKSYWTGSDVIYATKWPKHSLKRKWLYMAAYKVFARIVDIFVESHMVAAPHLIDELKPLRFKKPFEVLDPPIDYGYLKLIERKKHDGVNVLYYKPKWVNEPFRNWIYGIDIINELKEEIQDVNWIEVDGSQVMSEVYRITDIYLRPNRHDGRPRMVDECRYLGIDVIVDTDKNKIHEAIKRYCED